MMKGIIGIDRFWLCESWWRAPSRGQNNSRCRLYAAFSLYSHFPIELSKKWVIPTHHMNHILWLIFYESPTSWLGLNASYSDWSLYPASWNLQISSTSWLHVLARDILIFWGGGFSGMLVPNINLEFLISVTEGRLLVIINWTRQNSGLVLWYR